MRIAIATAALVVFASLVSLPSPASAQAGLGRSRTPPPEEQENKKGEEPTQEQAPAQQNEKKKKGKKDH